MPTKLDEIAAKARGETKLQFTSLCHHTTRERVWENLKQIPNQSAPRVDGIGVNEAKETFEDWIGPMLEAIHNRGYKAPPVRRVWILKPGRREKRPLGVPSAVDRLVQQAIHQILEPMLDPTFSDSSYGFRPGRSAHQALKKAQEYVRDG